MTSCGAAAAAVSSDYLATGTPLSTSTGGRAFASNAGGAIYAKSGVTARLRLTSSLPTFLSKTSPSQDQGDARSRGHPLFRWLWPGLK